MEDEKKDGQTRPDTAGRDRCGIHDNEDRSRRSPDAQILPLDYDPDVSFANIENRLQMLVMNVNRKKEKDPVSA